MRSSRGWLYLWITLSGLAMLLAVIAISVTAFRATQDWANTRIDCVDRCMTTFDKCPKMKDEDRNTCQAVSIQCLGVCSQYIRLIKPEPVLWSSP